MKLTFLMKRTHTGFAQRNTTFPLLFFHRTPWEEVMHLLNVAGTNMHVMYVTLEACASICLKHK